MCRLPERIANEEGSFGGGLAVSRGLLRVRRRALHP